MSWDPDAVPQVFGRAAAARARSSGAHLRSRRRTRSSISDAARATSPRCSRERWPRRANRRRRQFERDAREGARLRRRRRQARMDRGRHCELDPEPTRSMWSTAMPRCIGRMTTRDSFRGSSAGSRRAACSRCRCRINLRRRRTWRWRKSLRRASGAIGWRGASSRLRSCPLADYFELLAAATAEVDAWTTEYLHVLRASDDGVHPVVAWMKGTAMTPFLAALDGDEARAFIDDVSARVATAYPPLADGRVLFPFRRVFMSIASRAIR